MYANSVLHSEMPSPEALVPHIRTEGVTVWDADKVRKVKIVDVDGPTPLPELPVVVHVAPAPKAASVPAVKEGDTLDVL